MQPANNIYDLNSDLQPMDLRLKFAQAQRMQIPNFFPEQTAKEVEAELKALDWRLVLNEAGKHFDIHVSQIEALGAQKTALIIDSAKARAANGFQYLYENYPIADMQASGNLKSACLSKLYRTMNEQTILDFLNQVTDAGVSFCDMQATCYRAGHFLTRHDDGNIGKNRKFAYVYSLCPDWQAEWGGQLQFLNEEGNVEASFIPQYNTLSIFSVPYPHHVSQVSEFVNVPRMSITGWFRTGPKTL